MTLGCCPLWDNFETKVVNGKRRERLIQGQKPNWLHPNPLLYLRCSVHLDMWSARPVRFKVGIFLVVKSTIVTQGFRDINQKIGVVLRYNRNLRC